MAHKIRLGFVGANVRSTWSSQSHFPALLASPDVELTAVCTTKPESAEEARQQLGAKLAFHDFRAMVASPEIDAVAVVVRSPCPRSIPAGLSMTLLPLVRCVRTSGERCPRRPSIFQHYHRLYHRT